jgi:hypothetical protein
MLEILGKLGKKLVFTPGASWGLLALPVLLRCCLGLPPLFM